MSEFALICNQNKPSRRRKNVGHISRRNKSEHLQVVRHGDRLEILKAKAKPENPEATLK